MKALFVALALAGSSSVMAETVILKPGEYGTIGSTTVVCAGPTAQAPAQKKGPVCRLLGPGRHGNHQWNFRVAVDGDILSAADGLENALAQISKYRTVGLCTGMPQGTCKLMGPGRHGIHQWNFRVAIDEEVVGAADGQDNALNIIKSLRDNGLCKR